MANSVRLYSLGKLDQSMFMVTVCEMFGWTYEEYMNQPAFFIELITEKVTRDNKHREMEIRKNNRGK